jgi:tRNA1(Val) A37 N6-methylase TrmN6
MEITENKLLDGRVTLLQPKKGYRVAVDPVLLAASVPAAEGDCILDLGSGTGAVSLCLQARVPGCSIIGIENNLEYLSLSQQSVEKNNWQANIRFIEGRVEAPPAELQPDFFDWVVANPPYYMEQGYSVSLQAGKSAAHARDGELREWIDCAHHFVKPGGWFFMVYPANEDDEDIAGMSRVFQEVRILRIQPKVSFPTKRHILAARKGGGPFIREAGTLILHEDNGDFTAKARAILWDAAPLTIV